MGSAMQSEVTLVQIDSILRSTDLIAKLVLRMSRSQDIKADDVLDVWQALVTVRTNATSIRDSLSDASQGGG